MDANTVKDMLQRRARQLGEALSTDLSGLPLGEFKLTADVTVVLTAQIPVLPDPTVTFKVTASVRPTPAGPAVEVSGASIVPSVRP